MRPKADIEPKIIAPSRGMASTQSPSRASAAGHFDRGGQVSSDVSYLSAGRIGVRCVLHHLEISGAEIRLPSGPSINLTMHLSSNKSQAFIMAPSWDACARDVPALFRRGLK
jgi:hypothetical protein